MSGPIQSSDYVPGVSGWKIDQATGDFEFNPVRPSSGAAPQTITVIAGEWAENDLPANAIERYGFIGVELAKIPAEHRDNAEFSSKDFSFDCDGSDLRTTLTYRRLETQDEVVARLVKAKVAGTRLVRAGGCTTMIHDGAVRLRFGDLTKPADIEPFKVIDDAVYVSEALIKGGQIASPWPAAWNVRMKLSADGKYVAAGIGIGIETNADFMPDIIAKASHMEILPGGLVKISQAPKKA